MKLPGLPAFIDRELSLDIREDALIIAPPVRPTGETERIFKLWSRSPCLSSSCVEIHPGRRRTALNTRAPIICIVLPSCFGAWRNGTRLKDTIAGIWSARWSIRNRRGQESAP